MKQDTKWRLRDSEGKEYIIIDTEKVDMQEELNKMITKQIKEIERLNNIINELEVFLKEGTELTTGCGITNEYIYAYENALDKLQELKGSGKE